MCILTGKNNHINFIYSILISFGTITKTIDKTKNVTNYNLPGDMCRLHLSVNLIRSTRHYFKEFSSFSAYFLNIFK